MSPLNIILAAWLFSEQVSLTNPQKPRLFIIFWKRRVVPGKHNYQKWSAIGYKAVNIINPCNQRSSVADKNFSHGFTQISLITPI